MKYQDHKVTCLGCSQPVLGNTVINRMPDGTSCKICVERVLDAQPSLLINEEAREPSEESRMAPILHFPTPQHVSWEDDPEPA
ncbi:MAG: hypothetical protein KDB61_01820 [Planctomycetes bacterium]|nr:hypothetical protein [Planctomycetota bacterium]